MRYITFAFLTSVATSGCAANLYKDVLPVLQQRCQACHRPGEAAPMSFLTYESTRPWAAAIREAVRTAKMPPWGADSAHGKFANDPSLTCTGAADPGRVGGGEGSRRESEGCSCSGEVGRRMEHRRTRSRVLNAKDLRGTGYRNDRLHAVRHPAEVFGRSLGQRGGSPTR